MEVTYGKGFLGPMRGRVNRLQEEVSKLPQFEPTTVHTFHGGMYCREVFRPAGVVIVGKVHKKEHFYFVVSGTVLITTEDGMMEVTGPKLLCGMPGTKRAVYALTDAFCMTFHATQSASVEAAEEELVEDDPKSMFTIGNKIKTEKLS